MVRGVSTLLAILLGACGDAGQDPTTPRAVPISAPSDLTAQVESATRVRLAWRADAGGIGLFRVERRLARGCAENYFRPASAAAPSCPLPDTVWREVATGGAADRSWTDTAAVPNREHAYRVVACDASGADATCTTSAPTATTTFAAVSGTVSTVDGGTLPDLIVTLRASDGRTGSAPIPADGAFQMELPFSAPGWSEIEVATSDPEEGAYFPALFRLEALEFANGLRLLLVPRAWTVERGEYAGRVVPVSLDDAFDGRVALGSFYQSASTAESFAAFLYPWSADFPIPLWFDRARSDRPIEASDSVAYWVGVESLEHVLGRDLFRPAEGPVAGPAVRVSLDATLSSSGRGTPFTGPPAPRRLQEVEGWHGNVAPVASLGTACVDSSEVVVASRGLLANSWLTAHELIHLLGVGHGCRWPSIMTDCAGSNRMTRTDVPTAADVAYLELMAALIAQRGEDDAVTDLGVLAALAGERTVLKHEAPFPNPLPACWPGC
jgi:hypothetical protein